MPETLQRQVTQSLARGMWRGVDLALVPDDAAHDIEGLLDSQGLPYGRGGSEYVDPDPLDAPITFMWQGVLLGGQRTLVWSNSDPTDQVWRLDSGALTNQVVTVAISPYAPPAVIAGQAFFAGGVKYDGTSWSTWTALTGPVATAGFRLWRMEGRRLEFSALNAPTTFGATDFHELPDGAYILGAVGFRDSLMVFTTVGVFRISNITQPLTDADGNILHRIDLLSRDVILLGQQGIAAWEDALIVPAIDGVWLVRAGVESEVAAPFERISDPIAPLYRERFSGADAAQAIGKAEVFSGHYLLPVPVAPLSTEYEILACKLDSPRRPWTRLTGSGANVRALLRTIDTTNAAATQLLAGARSGHVMQAHYFDPSLAHAQDANTDSVEFSITTKDMATGSLNPNTVVKLRASYELDDGELDFPSELRAYVAVGDEDATLVLLAGPSVSGNAPVDAEGLVPFMWPVRKRARFVRFKIRTQFGYAKVRIRALEVFVRPSGRV